ncbi:MAG: helix-turn-helix transcriptional regulator [Chitinophagaceae bacterium]|nr:helix-turn-helix transcriptional regulator [Chitinophagaceae bacterium]
MRIYIKNMVSLRCKMIVEAELKRLKIKHAVVELGEVDIMQPLSDSKRYLLKTVLQLSGLELMDDKKAILVERIKSIIIEMVHYSDELPREMFSSFLTAKLHYNYSFLSNLFSEVKGTTIEQFIILHRIERVKEFILYNELNLTQIADKMHYSSVAHLSNQFKKVTGLTPSFFKSLKNKRRTVLESL